MLMTEDQPEKPAFFPGRRKKSSKISGFFVGILLAFIFLFQPASVVEAAGAPIRTIDPAKIAQELKEWMEEFKNQAWEMAKSKAGSQALQTAARNALNKIAYDTAT
ncbi:MAG: hypothetical protein MUC28_04040, partial [Planctomycetes bacterium]|nr:hypothetical protein [Planctomycetota bacterium]